MNKLFTGERRLPAYEELYAAWPTWSWGNMWTPVHHFYSRNIFLVNDMILDDELEREDDEQKTTEQ
jgi:hypothetical protein